MTLSFDPVNDIPDLSGKSVFITGGTNGLGKETILALAAHLPANIFFTGRNAASASEILSQVKTATSTRLTFIPCDQLSLSSVAEAARTFLSSNAALDIIICNAGVMATAPALTADGYENQFGVNHVAHALLVKLLLPALKSSADPRIIFLTSLGYQYSFPEGIRFDDLKNTQDTGPGSQWLRYGQSKLANVLYAAQLARRYPDVLSVALHPGAVKTDLIGRLSDEEKELVYASNDVIYEPREGAFNTCWAATSERAGVRNGRVYLPVGLLGEQTATEKDENLGEKLWVWTQEELKDFKSVAAVSFP